MPERYRSRQTPQTHFIMKNILFILAIALASVSNAQSLNDILDGVYEPPVDSELSTPLLLSMVPQNGTPFEVLVIRVADANPDSLYENGINPSLSNDLQLYAVFNGAEELTLPLFESGVYSIVCLDSLQNNVGEGTTVIVNENFLQGLVDTGYAQKRNSLVVSTKPLRIGRDNPEFVSFN